MKKSRQEWLKLGDDFSEDVLVSVDKKFLNNSTLSGTFITERYAKHEVGIEVHYISFVERVPRYYVAIFASSKTANLKFSSEVPYKSDTRNGTRHKSRSPMLVPIPHSGEDMEEARPIASTIQLFAHNPVLDFCRKTSNLTPVFLGENGGRVFEFESKVVGAISRPCQPMHQIVNDRTKIMNRISNSKTKPRMRVLYDPHDELNMANIPFYLHLANYFIVPIRKEGISIDYELIDAMPCPIDPRLGKLHICRTGATHEANETGSGNIERCGNTNPKAGRLLQESEESRHAVSVQPSEEVASQTAPSRPRDGCTATRTRSNNPEGAS